MFNTVVEAEAYQPSCWLRRVLKVDGYDAAGERVYDKVHGKTCHQCRQKTIGKRTHCSHCQSADVRCQPCAQTCTCRCPARHDALLKP